MAMKRQTVTCRFSREQCQSGLDGLNVEYTLELADAEEICLPQEKLKNEADETIASIQCVRGKITAYVNVVHCIRPNNVKPFGIADAIKMELAREQIIDFMKSYIQRHLSGQAPERVIQNTQVKSLECNITLPCVGKATPSAVVALFDLAFNRTVLFRKQRENVQYEKVNMSCLYTKPKKYRLKIYDKTAEQREKGNLLVEKKLLRIEVVFLDRSLHRMYGKKRTVIDVLSAHSIEVMCQEYKRVFGEDIINRNIKPFLNYCVKRLFESLATSENGNEISETIARCRELIPDIEVLRKALKKWYRHRGIGDNSKQAIRHYRSKNLGLPEDVLKTIRVFHKAAG